MQGGARGTRRCVRRGTGRGGMIQGPLWDPFDRNADCWRGERGFWGSVASWRACLGDGLVCDDPRTAAWGHNCVEPGGRAGYALQASEDY